jgi:hypothetical protein
MKGVLARLPGMAELYQQVWANGAAPTGGYSLDRLAAHLPSWVEAVGRARRERESEVRRGKGGGLGGRRSSEAEVDREDRLALPPRRLLVFGYLQWWLEYSVALALLLRAEGHQVDLAFLPQRRWHMESHPFDLRRQFAYVRGALSPLSSELGLLPLVARGDELPDPLAQSIEAQSRLDVQYTLQRETLDWVEDPEVAGLLRLRRARNRAAAVAGYRLLQARNYDAVVIPNGSILEFGALYRTAAELGTATVSYEFGERREHLWLAQAAEVMRLPTDELWAARGQRPLTDLELNRLRELYQARRGGQRWSQFSRQWQRTESAGAQAVRKRLGLADDRPVVLMCTNVVGDSLALDRQIFTHGMADWLAETVRGLATRPEVQLVVRVHPGEMLGAGHSSIEIVRQVNPELPPGVVVIPPDSEINTYDLIGLAHLGLVYTSTVGLEMAMFGLPVVVCGDTHYRGKGFTYDPASMPEYLAKVGSLLQDPLGRSLPPEQVELAWRYAHLFFFEFPFPFPWHLLSFWEDLAARPLEQVVGEGAQGAYARTLRALAGEPIDWVASREPLDQEEPQLSPLAAAAEGQR